jgi:PAS domain S-box-containing protein
MAARVTDAMQTRMAAFPQHPPAGSSLAHAKAREATFAALSRELRFCLDANGCFAHLDGAWQGTLGHEPAELHGSHWSTVVAADDHAAMRTVIKRALAQAAPEIELRMRASAGPSRLVHWTLVPGTGGEVIAAVGYERTPPRRDGDAARLQRRVDELEVLIEDLGDHSRSMEGFAATAAHQLSEPLIVAESGTIMVAEELGEELDPDLRARLDAIGRGAARARQVIDALLIDARSASGLELKPVDAATVVTHVLEDLAPRMRDRAVVTDVGKLPTVRAEARLLAVVYQNLLSNALKYGPRDGGLVRIRSERCPEGWKLVVASEGAPLPADQTRRIFEPWRRIPGERRAPGSGLGLAICARLIERMGGSIGVEPLSDGNSFYFVLPAA